jgi:hypothetical protein
MAILQNYHNTALLAAAVLRRLTPRAVRPLAEDLLVALAACPLSCGPAVAALLRPHAACGAVMRTWREPCLGVKPDGDRSTPVRKLDYWWNWSGPLMHSNALRSAGPITCSRGCTGTDGKSGTMTFEFLWDGLGIRDVRHNEAPDAPAPSHARRQTAAWPTPSARGHRSELFKQAGGVNP